MKRSFATVWILISTFLTACGIGPHQMNGVSGKERTEYLNSIKPYGAHWVKEGMTRESRRADSWACGAAKTLIGADHPVFPNSELEAAKLPGDLNDILAIGRITDKWAACMQAKGYARLEKCDARCMYP